MNRSWALCCGIVALLATVANAGATDWPARPVHVIVPFAAGGAADAQGRLYADVLSAAFGKPFIVENPLPRSSRSGMNGAGERRAWRMNSQPSAIVATIGR